MLHTNTFIFLHIYASIHAPCIKTLFIQILWIHYYYYYYYYYCRYVVGLLEGGTLPRKSSKLIGYRTQTLVHPRLELVKNPLPACYKQLTNILWFHTTLPTIRSCYNVVK